MHLASKHSDDYNKVIIKNGWGYRLSNDIKPSKSNTVDVRKLSLPPFSQASFIKYIVRFVVADDQVSNAFSH